MADPAPATLAQLQLKPYLKRDAYTLAQRQFISINRHVKSGPLIASGCAEWVLTANLGTLYCTVTMSRCPELSKSDRGPVRFGLRRRFLSNQRTDPVIFRYNPGLLRVLCLDDDEAVSTPSFPLIS